MSKFLEKLKTDILVADGAMGTLLYTYGLDTCHESYNVTHPEKVLAIHQAYIEAGCRCYSDEYLRGSTSSIKELRFGRSGCLYQSSSS